MTTGLVVVETRITTFLVVVSTFSVVVDKEVLLGIIDETSDVATVLGLNDGIRDVGIENPGVVGTENGEAVELLNFAWS